MSSANSKGAFFTMEDAKASFNLFCCVCGIGAIFFSTYCGVPEASG
jgi:vesicular inhibitory amino acid transporter